MSKTCESCRYATPGLIGESWDCSTLELEGLPEDFACNRHEAKSTRLNWRVTRLEGQEATRELRELCKHLRRQAKATSSGVDYRVRLTSDGIALEISEPPQGPLPCEDDQLAAIDAEITESARLVHRRKREPKPETELGRRLTALRSNLE
jgi:hypothetical protein